MSGGERVVRSELVGNSDAALENRARLLRIVDSGQDRIVALAASGASGDALKRKSGELKQEFIDRATALGFPRDGVLKYAGAFDDMGLAIDRTPRSPAPRREQFGTEATS